MRKCAKAYYADVNAWLAVNATGGAADSLRQRSRSSKSTTATATGQRSMSLTSAWRKEREGSSAEQSLVADDKRLPPRVGSRARAEGGIGAGTPAVVVLHTGQAVHGTAATRRADQQRMMGCSGAGNGEGKGSGSRWDWQRRNEATGMVVCARSQRWRGRTPEGGPLRARRPCGGVFGCCRGRQNGRRVAEISTQGQAGFCFVCGFPAGAGLAGRVSFLFDKRRKGRGKARRGEARSGRSGSASASVSGSRRRRRASQAGREEGRRERRVSGSGGPAETQRGRRARE